MKNNKPKPIELRSIKIYCPNLNKEIELKEGYYFSSSEQECEICGSHGERTLSIINCECGETHSELVLNSW